MHYQDDKVHSVMVDIRNWVERKLLTLRMFPTLAWPVCIRCINLEIIYIKKKLSRNLRD